MPITPWTQTVEREARTFAGIPGSWRPCVLGATLFAAANALMFAGDAAHPRYALPLPSP